MAERGGFEPPRRCYRPTGIRSQTLQPLGYLSTASVILTYSRNLHNSKKLVNVDIEALTESTARSALLFSVFNNFISQIKNQPEKQDKCDQYSYYQGRAV